jgi:serine protease
MRKARVFPDSSCFRLYCHPWDEITRSSANKVPKLETLYSAENHQSVSGVEDLLGKHEGRAPSCLPILLVLLVGLAGLPAAYVVPSSSQGAEAANETSTTAATSFGTTRTSTIPTLTTASDEIRVGNKTLGSLTAAYSANQVVVKYRRLAKIHATEKNHDVRSEKKLLLERLVLLNVTEGKVKDVIEALRNDPDVEYVEPNYIRTVSFIPNDPYYIYQWHFTAIQMNQAWDISTGQGVTVAVIDTGVAYEDYLGFRQAPDLSGTTFVSGWDFVNNDAHPNDDYGHGTHVCGTIAQSTNNGIGVAGVAFNARIMPIKVLDQQGNGWDSDVANGITWAVNNGAKIISLSLGGPDYSQTLEDAVNYAYAHGVTVVASSGNDNSGSVGYPAAYVNAIAVGAVRYDQTRAYYSNYGTALDFVAPGGDVRVDQNGDGYADGVLQQTFCNPEWDSTGCSVTDPTDFHYYFLQGTSMAAPHVSGLAALLYAAGYTTPDQIRQRMINGAKDLGSPGWDQYYGHGLIQCYNTFGPRAGVSQPYVLGFKVSGQVYSDSAVGDYYYSSTGWSPTDASFTVDLGAGESLFLIGTAQVWNDYPSIGSSIGITRGGTLVSGDMFAAGATITSRELASAIAVDTPGAGTWTYALAAKTDPGGKVWISQPYILGFIVSNVHSSSVMGDYSYSSTGWSSSPASFTVDLGAGESLFLIGTAQVWNDYPSIGSSIAITRDGARISGDMFAAGATIASRELATAVAIDTPGAGTYTYSLSAKTDPGGKAWISQPYVLGFKVSGVYSGSVLGDYYYSTTGWSPTGASFDASVGTGESMFLIGSSQLWNDYSSVGSSIAITQNGVRVSGDMFAAGATITHRELAVAIAVSSPGAGTWTYSLSAKTD